MQAIEVRDDEMERRLGAYARARLSPDPRAIARVRARIMREARLQFEASRIAVHIAPAVIRQTHRSLFRRVAMPLLAASVWLGIAVGSISASQAGGPLYATRMWAENAMLPDGRASRAAAELGRLDARLAEAYAAATRGDAGAVNAALDAYRLIADDAIAASTGDLSLEATVATALDKHKVVLEAVAAGLVQKGDDNPAAAVEAAIQRAIERTQAVVDQLHANGAGNGGTSPKGQTGPGTSGVGSVVAGPSVDPGPAGSSPVASGDAKGGEPARTSQPRPAPTAQGQPAPSPREKP
ncbi:MAG: hypothetical protein NVS9B8_11690 [Candidatus Limnocylindrales bacterium]